MNDKKLKGKQKWCLNTVATLKPFIERKEHITRSTAVRLAKPNTNWQRRELDTLRKQANQIIRGDNVNALVYGIFGMTLEHPEMQSVKESFDATTQQHCESYTVPDNLHVRGAQASVSDLDRNWARTMNNPVADYDSHRHKEIPVQHTTTAPDVEVTSPEPPGLPSNIVLAEPDMDRYLTSMFTTTHGSIAVASDTVYIFDKQYGWCLREAYEEQLVVVKKSLMQRLLGWLCK